MAQIKTSTIEIIAIAIVVATIVGAFAMVIAVATGAFDRIVPRSVQTSVLRANTILWPCG